jgi:hypothetical protein
MPGLDLISDKDSMTLTVGPASGQKRVLEGGRSKLRRRVFRVHSVIDSEIGAESTYLTFRLVKSAFQRRFQIMRIMQCYEPLCRISCHLNHHPSH